MQPHSLSNISVGIKKTPAEKAAAPRPHGTYPKGTVLPETRVLACPRVKVADLPEGFLPTKYFEALEQNQQIASCCRHPENHDVSAFKSHPDEPAPDIYHFHCDGCGRTHVRLCLGFTDDNRPSWKAG